MRVKDKAPGEMAPAAVLAVKLASGGAAGEADAFFSQFGLDRRCGFLALQQASLRLAPPYDAWEALAVDLPALLTSGQLPLRVKALPLLDARPLMVPGMEAASQRALSVLSFVAHAALAAHLGTLPITSYATTVIYNFRLIDESLSFGANNIWAVYTTTGAIDEVWFFLISAAIEGQSATILPLYFSCRKAMCEGDNGRVEQVLIELASQIDNLTAILERMYEDNLPQFFHKRLQHYLFGWRNDARLPNGLVYEDGSEHGVALQIAGASAAQSPLMQSLDIFLGIVHDRPTKESPPPTEKWGDEAHTYLQEMRSYMVARHREALQWLEENFDTRTYILASPSAPLNAAYNQCLGALRAFRSAHFRMVSLYILSQASKGTTAPASDGQGSLGDGAAPRLGTGGSHVATFLKGVRSHVDNASIVE